MVQIIEQQDKFGKVGQSFGKGLGDSIPEEVDRYRLAQGLNKFATEAEGRNPLQNQAAISSIPGVTPQMIQSFGELAKQQSQANSIKNLSKEPVTNPYKSNATNPEKPKEDKAPSLTTATPIEETLKPYIPKTYDEKLRRSAQLFEANPGLYKNDPSLAFTHAESEDQSNQLRSKSIQDQRLKQQNVQEKVETELKSQATKLGANVPGTVYSEVENQAINSVKPIAEGGEGLTEQQAKKKYGLELDAISRGYQALKTLGIGKFLTQTPEGNKQTLKSIREGFKERNDLENLALTYIEENKLSPAKAFYLAYPVNEVKELNNIISKLPTLNKEVTLKRGFPEKVIQSPEKTYELAPKIAQSMGQNGSPLAIGEELQSRGYDRNAWLDYVDKNRKKLNLTARQERELDFPRDNTPTLDDIWLFTFSGLDKIVEQQ